MIRAFLKRLGFGKTTESGDDEGGDSDVKRFHTEPGTRSGSSTGTDETYLPFYRRRFFLAVLLIFLFAGVFAYLLSTLTRSSDPIPVILASFVEYNAPLVPNSRAREDLNALKSFVDSTADSRVYSLDEQHVISTDSLDSLVKEILTKLQTVKPGGSSDREKDTAIVYLSALAEFGDDADEIDGKNVHIVAPDGHSMPVSDLIKLLRESAAMDDTIRPFSFSDPTTWGDAIFSSKRKDNKTVILDLKPIRRASRKLDSESVLNADSFGSVGKASSEDTIDVLMSVGSGNEKSWIAPELGCSVFAHFVIKALAGQADSDDDRKITLKEFSDYVSNQVSQWVSVYRDSKQAPRLLTPDSDSEVGRSTGVAPPEVASFAREFKNPSALWDWHGRNKGTLTQSTHPIIWAKIEAGLLRLSELQFGGEAYRAQYESLASKLTEYRKKVEQIPVSKLRESYSITTYGSKNPPDLTELRKWIKASGRPKNDKQEPLRAVSYQHGANLGWNWILHKARTAGAINRSDIEEVLTHVASAKVKPSQDCVEIHYLKMLDEYVDWDAPESRRNSAIAESLLTRFATEKLLRSIDPRVIYQSEDELTKLDQERRVNEDQLFVAQGSPERFGEIRTKLVNLRTVLKEETIQRKTKEHMFNDLPYLLSWMTNSDVPQDSILTEGSDSDSALSDYLKLKRKFQIEVQDLIAEAGDNAHTLRRILVALRVPLLTGSDRADLLAKAERIMSDNLEEKRAGLWVANSTSSVSIRSLRLSDRIEQTIKGKVPYGKFDSLSDVQATEHFKRLMNESRSANRERLREIDLEIRIAAVQEALTGKSRMIGLLVSNRKQREPSMELFRLELAMRSVTEAKRVLADFWGPDPRGDSDSKFFVNSSTKFLNEADRWKTRLSFRGKAEENDGKIEGSSTIEKQLRMVRDIAKAWDEVRFSGYDKELEFDKSELRIPGLDLDAFGSQDGVSVVRGKAGKYVEDQSKRVIKFRDGARRQPIEISSPEAPQGDETESSETEFNLGTRRQRPPIQFAQLIKLREATEEVPPTASEDVKSSELPPPRTQEGRPNEPELSAPTSDETALDENSVKVGEYTKELTVKSIYRGHVKKKSIVLKRPEPMHFTARSKLKPPSIVVRSGKSKFPVISFVLDCSQTMDRKRKYYLARDAFEWTISQLPSTTWSNLWLFGHRAGWGYLGEPKFRDKAKYSGHPNGDVELVFPKGGKAFAALSSESRQAIVRQLSLVEPLGQTPLYLAMTMALPPLGKAAQQNFASHLVIFTDGKNQQTSGGNKLMRRSLSDVKSLLASPEYRNVKISLVGFQFNGDAELRSLVASHGGEFYRADSHSDLNRLLNQLTSTVKPSNFVVEELSAQGDSYSIPIGQEWTADEWDEAANAPRRFAVSIPAKGIRREVIARGGERIVLHYNSKANQLSFRDLRGQEIDDYQALDVSSKYQNVGQTTRRRVESIQPLVPHRFGNTVRFRMILSGDQYTKLPNYVTARVYPLKIRPSNATLSKTLSSRDYRKVTTFEPEASQAQPTIVLPVSDWPVDARFALIMLQMNFDPSSSTADNSISLQEALAKGHLLSRYGIEISKVEELSGFGGLDELRVRVRQEETKGDLPPRYSIRFTPPADFQSGIRRWKEKQEQDFVFSNSIAPKITVERRGDFSKPVIFPLPVPN